MKRPSVETRRLGMGEMALESQGLGTMKGIAVGALGTNKVYSS